MTMQVMVVNKDGSPARRVKVEASDGVKTTIEAGHHAEFWIHNGKTLAISEEED